MKETGNDNLSLQAFTKWTKERMFDFSSSQDCSVIWVLNDTGDVSVRGTVVRCSLLVDLAIDITVADEEEAVGSILKSGIPDGELVPVGHGGVIPVLLQDGTGCTRSNWCRTSITDPGRADGTLAAPPGGGVANLDKHMKELGHCFESKGSGTDVICLIITHQN